MKGFAYEVVMVDVEEYKYLQEKNQELKEVKQFNLLGLIKWYFNKVK